MMATASQVAGSSAWREADAAWDAAAWGDEEAEEDWRATVVVEDRDGDEAEWASAYPTKFKVVVEDKDGRGAEVEVDPVYVCLARMRKECRTEKQLVNAVGGVVAVLDEALRRLKSGDTHALAYYEESGLVDRRYDVRPSVASLLFAAGATPTYSSRRYDVIFMELPPERLNKLTHILALLRHELHSLRLSTAIKAPSLFNPLAPLTGHADHSSTVQQCFPSLASLPEPSLLRVFNWCATELVLVAGDPSLQEEASALLIEVAKVRLQLGRPYPTVAASPEDPEPPNPTTPAGRTNYWRLTEMFSQPEPWKVERKHHHHRGSTHWDPVVLMNIDSTCWLNTVLVAVLMLPKVRAAVLRTQPVSGFVEAVQKILAFSSPGSLHKYIFNSCVRESLEEVQPDAAEFLTLLPDLLEAGGVSDTSSLFKVGSVPVARDGKPAEGQTNEFPLMVSPSSNTAAPRVDSLSMKLMRSLETANTGSSAFKAMAEPPETLSVVVRRSQWDKALGKAFTSTAKIDTPTQLKLGNCAPDEGTSALRARLQKAEADLSALESFDPKQQYSIKPDPMPECLRSQNEAGYRALQATLDSLNNHVLELSAARAKQLEDLRLEVDTVLDELKAREDLPSYTYELVSGIAFTEHYGRGHYWAYTKATTADGSWLKCDDAPTPGELPEYTPCTEESAIESLSTHGSCFFYARVGVDDIGYGAGLEWPVSEALSEEVAAENQKLRSVTSRLEVVEVADSDSSSSVAEEQDDGYEASGIEPIEYWAGSGHYGDEEEDYCRDYLPTSESAGTA